MPGSLTDDSGMNMGWFIIAKDAILFEESETACCEVDLVHTGLFKVRGQLELVTSVSH